MPKRKKQTRLDFESLEPLSHNPFAALDPQADPEKRSTSNAAAATDAPAKSPSTNPRLLIRLERRARGKTATCVYHVEDDPAGALKRLRKKLATGGSLRDGVIELQGDCREAAAAHMEASGYAVKIG